MKLDYENINRLSKKPTKLQFELQFVLLAVSSFLTLTASRIAVLGAVAILRRLWKKLLKTDFFHRNPMVFNLVFGLYCLDALYLFSVTLRTVSLPS